MRLPNFQTLVFSASLRCYCMLHLQSNSTLCSIDLSWNNVRMASGVSLGQALAHNTALTELRLAHNSLADSGIQAVSRGCFTVECGLLFAKCSISPGLAL